MIYLKPVTFPKTNGDKLSKIYSHTIAIGMGEGRRVQVVVTGIKWRCLSPDIIILWIEMIEVNEITKRI